MKTSFQNALAAVGFALLPATSMAEQDCVKLAVSVKHAAAARPAKVLEIVEAELAANPDCACEVVKAAIEGAKADSKTVATIVEAAATTLPEKTRQLAQCAVAIAPDALGDVQVVVNRLDSKRAASASSAKEMAAKPAWNPLEFPGKGPVAPTPGGPPMMPPGLPPGVPPVAAPPVGTPGDRRNR